MIPEATNSDHYYQSMYRRNLVCFFVLKEVSAAYPKHYMMLYERSL